ncbi:DUF5791 family protein [Halobaculum sp. MBLA0147]|uniref:DUF5791 family protein n=1 Tax=Halobaculum sp. MBLA0147 TaxID=3079934 RepID=UPI003525BD58
MLYDTLADAEAPTPAEFRAAYAAELAAVVDEHGVETVAEAADLEVSVVAGFADGDLGETTLAEAAAVLSLSGPDAETVAAEVRDHLLMGMSTAILDVDTVAAEIDADLGGKAVRQALEGQIRLTLAELAEIQSLIRTRSR